MPNIYQFYVTPSVILFQLLNIFIILGYSAALIVVKKVFIRKVSKSGIHELEPLCDDYFRNLSKFFNDPIGYYQNDTRWGKWLAKNINFFDLGYSNELTDESEVNSAIDEIVEQFDFIMISDYMEESLILLKEELCLQISDIVFFSINKRLDPDWASNLKIS